MCLALFMLLLKLISQSNIHYGKSTALLKQMGVVKKKKIFQHAQCQQGKPYLRKQHES